MRAVSHISAGQFRKTVRRDALLKDRRAHTYPVLSPPSALSFTRSL